MNLNKIDRIPCVIKKLQINITNISNTSPRISSVFIKYDNKQRDNDNKNKTNFVIKYDDKRRDDRRYNRDGKGKIKYVN